MTTASAASFASVASTMAVQINARGEAELRDRIRRAARLADLSMNDWILRALESALGGAEESEHSPSDRSVAASSRTSANGASGSAPSEAQGSVLSERAGPAIPFPQRSGKTEGVRPAAPTRTSSAAKQGIRPRPKAGKRA